MIKLITKERARIEGYKHSVGGAQFFNDRRYREDLEWLILSYLTSALSAAGRECPEYAEKLPPPEADFQTYLMRDLPHWSVEITEVLRPGYRRGDFHRKAAQSGQRIYHIPNPDPQPWSSFLSVLRKKLAKSYSGRSSLLIYHDIPDSEFPEYAPWHERLFARLRTWTHDSNSTCDLTRSRYENIFVVDASGNWRRPPSPTLGCHSRGALTLVPLTAQARSREALTVLRGFFARISQLPACRPRTRRMGLKSTIRPNGEG